MYTLYVNETAVLFYMEKADSYLSRLRGWMFKQKVSPSDALWIVPCNSIHTFFMKFAIDVIFLDENGKIVKLCEHVSPRSTRFSFNAKAAIELHSGSVAVLKLKIGDQLLIKDSLNENL